MDPFALVHSDRLKNPEVLFTMFGREYLLTIMVLLDNFVMFAEPLVIGVLVKRVRDPDNKGSRHDIIYKMGIYFSPRFVLVIIPKRIIKSIFSD